MLNTHQKLPFFNLKINLKKLTRLFLGLITSISLSMVFNQAIASNLQTANTPTRLAAEQTTTPKTVTTAAPTQASEASSIHDILVSDQADDTGYVTAKKTTLPASAPTIFITVQVKSAQIGMNVSVIMTSPTGQKATLASKFTKSGNVMKAFAIKNSDPTWATGEYHVDVALSNGLNKSITFMVQ